jgi:hypothetical protein
MLTPSRNKAAINICHARVLIFNDIVQSKYPVIFIMMPKQS